MNSIFDCIALKDEPFCTKSAVETHSKRIVILDVKLIRAVVACGKSPEAIQLSYLKNIEGGGTR